MAETDRITEFHSATGDELIFRFPARRSPQQGMMTLFSVSALDRLSHRPPTLAA
jgi:hypothetical protein